MDFQVKDQLFVVTGAGSGFGRAIAELLLHEGAFVIAVARSSEVLAQFKMLHPERLEILAADITLDESQEKLLHLCKEKQLAGIVVNAGGPPAKAFLETVISEWDEAYRNVLRWKVAFVQKFMPLLLAQGYGRVLFIESISVKQPVENLVLSNSLRAAVVGFVKSLSADVADKNITLNVLAPGYHNTAAMQRLFDKKALNEKISPEQARANLEKQIPVKKMGEAWEMAIPALWLLSASSRYVTGQTISHDGGLIKGIFG